MTININQLKIGDVVPLPPEPKSEQQIMANWQGDPSKPLVSIVCHTFNHVNYIKDALNGFLMQSTDFAFEIILHDDASTDGTTEIVKEFAQSYPNIIVPIIQTENQWSKGVRPSTNTFPKAKGKYIAFCEGDDFWINENKIQKQYNYMIKNPKATLCFHDHVITNEEREVLKLDVLNNDVTKFNIEKIIDKWFISTQTIFFNKTYIIQSLSDFKNIVNGDWSFQLISAHHGDIVYLPDVLACYRKNDHSLSSSIAKNKATRAMNLIRLFCIFDVYSEFKYSNQINTKIIFYLKEYNDFLWVDEFERHKALYFIYPKIFFKKLKNKIRHLRLKQ